MPAHELADCGLVKSAFATPAPGDLPVAQRMRAAYWLKHAYDTGDGEAEKRSARRALERLVTEGMAWVDSQGGRTGYWFMSFWLEERLRTPPVQPPPLGPPAP